MPQNPVGGVSALFDHLEPRTLLDSSLSPPVIFQGEQSVNTVVAGDFDGDGLQDLAIASYGPVGKRLAFLKGNGDGTFEAPRFTRYAHNIAHLAAADFDGDDRDELVVAGLAKNGERSRLARMEFNDELQKLRVITSRAVPGFVQDIAVVRSADGPTHVLFAVRTEGPPQWSQQTPSLIHSIAFNEPGLPIVQTPVESTLAQWRGFRVTDANADGLDDIVFTSQDSELPEDEEFSVRVLTQSADPLLAGMFESPSTLLSTPGAAQSSALLADVDFDGDLDLVVPQRDDVILYRGDGGGGFLPPEVLFAGPIHYNGRNDLRIVGFQTGPTGEPELQIFHRLTVGGRHPYGVQSLQRLSPQEDGSFILREAFHRSNNGNYIGDQFLMVQLTNDAHADVLWLSTSHRRQAFLYVFDGWPRPPLISGIDASRAGRPNVRIVTTDQRIKFRARINDPEGLIGEPGGIRSIQFFLDTNNNGIIDPGDVLANTRTGNVMVLAHWPRGTFNVLVQAADIHGNQSAVYCAEQQLTIV
ncbi:MAG: VCBS repeat-containing protein [Phycisphaeraceae bacterium]|nr:VCBS repeat-containing protein [Phycisphaeraceae bacterium]MBX3405973.1 VCBS repeat-containing protein [Phycisphaeraceae bacterium]